MRNECPACDSETGYPYHKPYCPDAPQGVWYIHKMETQLAYGGPEEGGWYYNQEWPIQSDICAFTNEEAAHAQCRKLNEREQERQERENEYGYSSVLSYRDTFYVYIVTENMVAPGVTPRPRYE